MQSSRGAEGQDIAGTFTGHAVPNHRLVEALGRRIQLLYLLSILQFNFIVTVLYTVLPIL